jgi:hypothetical protein
MPEALSDTLFFEKYKLQDKLCSSGWFKSFDFIDRISPLSPSNMNKEQLKEIGHGLT